MQEIIKYHSSVRNAILFSTSFFHLLFRFIVDLLFICTTTARGDNKQSNKQTNKKNYNRQLCNECHCHRRCRGSSIPYAFDHRFHTQSHSTFAVWVYGSCSQNTPTKMYYLYMYRNYVYMTIGRVFKRFRFLVESKIFFFVVAKTG